MCLWHASLYWQTHIQQNEDVTVGFVVLGRRSTCSGSRCFVARLGEWWCVMLKYDLEQLQSYWWWPGSVCKWGNSPPAIFMGTNHWNYSRGTLFSDRPKCHECPLLSSVFGLLIQCPDLSWTLLHPGLGSFLGIQSLPTRNPASTWGILGWWLQFGGLFCTKGNLCCAASFANCPWRTESRPRMMMQPMILDDARCVAEW